uniref:Uncharacterized protein n=1 Tax=Rhizophagus irregularis (strain DAOM 181602 / DAOM 197198 / MUCL 43194) TaxID=747089 RepID=U9UHT7_RHIID
MVKQSVKWSEKWSAKMVDVEQLHTILAPAKKAIQAVEANSSNMALIFLELIQDGSCN